MTGAVLASGILFSGALVLSGGSPAAAHASGAVRRVQDWSAGLGALAARRRRRAAHAARGRHAAGPPTLLPHDYTARVPLPK